MSASLAVALGMLASRPLDQAPSIKYSADVESRVRFERRIDRAFGADSTDGRSELLWRVRPGITFSGDGWRGKIQWQYAHSMIWTPARNFSTENQDASLAYVQFDLGKGKLTAGRQKINLDDERLIGTLEWSNLARSMDGVRYQGDGWDAFAFQFGVAPNRPKDARVLGVNHKHSRGSTSYILKMDDTSAGDVSVHTLTHVWKGRIAPRVTAEAEAAIQFGRVAGRDLGAFAVHVRSNYAIDPKLSIGLEGNLATGGQSAGHTKTFDNLYPTNHKFYGAADLQAWRNMQEITAHLVYKPDSLSSLAVGWHHFWLFDKTDGWYGAGGGINSRPGGSFIDPTGSSGRYVGTELDLTYNRKLGNVGSLSIGVSWFDPGTFVTRLNGGNGRTQIWGFAMFGYRF